MGTPGLRRALAAGAPLIEVVVRFRPGIDFADATGQVNALADDFDLHPEAWYGDPALRVGSATNQALERLFGWRIVRVPLERHLEATGEWSVWPDTFRWEELSSPQRMPPAAAQLIDSISITQPGADDEGQPFPWPAPDPVVRR